jgi:hypothetical protein
MKVFRSTVPSFAHTLTAVWERSVITMLGVKVIVDMAAEACRAMKPRTGANKDSTAEPFGAVVAIWRTAIWSRIIVTIGTLWCDTDIYTYLCLGLGSTRSHAESSSTCHDEIFQATHKSPLTTLDYLEAIQTARVVLKILVTGNSIRDEEL